MRIPIRADRSARRSILILNIIAPLCTVGCIEFPLFSFDPPLMDANPVEEMMDDMDPIEELDMGGVIEEPAGMDMGMDLIGGMPIDLAGNDDMDMGIPIEEPMDMGGTPVEPEPIEFTNHLCVDGVIEGSTPPVTCQPNQLEWIKIPAGMAGIGLANIMDMSAISPTTVPMFVMETNGYYLSKREITVGDYFTCIDQNGGEACPPKNELILSANSQLCSICDDRSQCEGLPINCLNWTQAQRVCEWMGGRLPTESEWEYGVSHAREFYPVPWDRTRILFESEQSCPLAHVRECPNATLGPRAPCEGDENPTADGPLFCDTIGNLSEWTLDPYSPEVTPMQAEEILSASCEVGATKTLKGGNFQLALTGAGRSPEQLTYYARQEATCDLPSPTVGFRCLLPLPSEQK